MVTIQSNQVSQNAANIPNKEKINVPRPPIFNKK